MVKRRKPIDDEIDEMIRGILLLLGLVGVGIFISILCEFEQKGGWNRMHEKTGSVVPTSKINKMSKKTREEFSEPFHENELVHVKGLDFRIRGWKQGILILRLEPRKN